MAKQLNYLGEDNFARMKRCSVCKKLKAESEFHRNRKSPDGLGSRCKECSSVYQPPHKPVAYKKCRWCGLTKPASEFSPHRGNSDRLQARCRECHNKTSNKLMLEQRNIRKAKFVEMSGQVCQKCGYEGFQAALEFHHVNPEEKERTPANLFTGGALPDETIYAELDKCVLLCANCHRAFEASEWTAEFVRRGEKLLGYTVKKEDLQS